MVEVFEVSALSSSTPAQVGVGVRVSSVPRGVLEGRKVVHEVGLSALGPRFIGNVVMASEGGQLVAVGHVADHELQVWCGSERSLSRVTEFAAPVPAGGLVALVRFRNEWHLFARSEHGRSSHLVSTDLCAWSHLTQLVSSFPAFAVSGVAACGDELLLAGRIYVDNTAFGWGLLRSDGRAFEARPVPLPLATQLGVVGPVVNDDGDTVLLLDSGHNRTVATANGLGWTLSLMLPDVTPTAVFQDRRHMWLVGEHNETKAPALARINETEVVELPAALPGRIRAAVIHGDHLVLARET